ncbi:hypothetical protein [Sutcliffiella sp. NC1]|uniref:hypothetical protein n=1 Tax=Sutcliffiella sp. NC1 TaxID=3004096 RepID=UPI0022DD03E9|nr:hypothetical protein [Sutcliffiella sp. NC1]WBL16358.1 hypothetical protein O1A01_06925 [Sutcliffiella sp. NC1]
MNTPKFNVNWDQEKLEEIRKMFKSAVQQELNETETRLDDYIVLIKGGAMVILEKVSDFDKTETDITFYDENEYTIGYFKLDEIKGFYAYKEPELML